jgi:transcription antitermination protein NusB
VSYPLTKSNIGKLEDKRHNARIIVLQRLFQRSFPGVDPTQNINQEYSDIDLLDADEISNFDEKLALKLFNGVLENYKEIDLIIAEFAPEWPIDKIAKTDLNILRIAIYEAFLTDTTPMKVAIDEAIELAKEFSNEQSRKFINGVLGTLIKEYQKRNAT